MSLLSLELQVNVLDYFLYYLHSCEISFLLDLEIFNSEFSSFSVDKLNRYGSDDLWFRLRLFVPQYNILEKKASMEKETYAFLQACEALSF